MIRYGFTLFQLLIYLSLSVFMISLVCSFGISLHTTIRSKRVTTDRLIEWALALEALQKDTQRASQECCTFKRAHKDALVLSLPHKDIGWIQKNRRVMRYEGRYNGITDRWAGVSSSRVVSDGKVLFTYAYDKGRCSGVTCTLYKGSSSLRRYLRL